MASIQDSIEKCSICQNSRNKKFLMAPQNYNHIFGYIGPANKYNLIELFNAKGNISSYKIHKKHLKKSDSRLSNIYYTKNLDIRKGNSQKWIQPGTFLYSVKSHKYDKTKMRYDESDSDFKDFKKPIIRSTKKGQKNKSISKIKISSKKIRTHYKNNMRAKCWSPPVHCLSKNSIRSNKKKKKARVTDSEDRHSIKMEKNCNKKIQIKSENSQRNIVTHGNNNTRAKCCLSKNSILNDKKKKATRRTDSEDKLPLKIEKNSNYKKNKVKAGNSGKKIVTHDNNKMRIKCWLPPVNCLSKDSILNYKKKKKTRKTDSEDMLPLKMEKNTKSKKNNLSTLDSDFSIDSTKKLNRIRRNFRNTSTSSMKIQNLKLVMNSLFGSVESIKNTKHPRKQYNISKPIDPEDIEPRIIRLDKNMKKPAAAFTNSDFSLNSCDNCHKKKRKNIAARQKKSDSSTDLDMRSKLRNSCFDSIESMKCLRKREKKPQTVDAEDEMLYKFPWPQIFRRKTTKGRAPPIKKKKSKILSNLSKYFICTDFDNKQFK